MADEVSWTGDLRFDRPVATDADLLFGADFVAPRNDLTLLATLPGLTVQIRCIPPVRVELQAALPPPTGSVWLRPSVPLQLGTGPSARLPDLVVTGEVRYDSHTARPKVGSTQSPWRGTRSAEDGATLRAQDSQATPAGWRSPWQEASRAPVGLVHRLPPVLEVLDPIRCIGYQAAARLQDRTGFAHQDGRRIGQVMVGAFDRGSDLRQTTGFRHQDGDRQQGAQRLARWQSAGRQVRGQGSDFQVACPLRKGWQGRYQGAVPPPPGISGWVIPEPPQPPVCYLPSGQLVFIDGPAVEAVLVFVCESAPPPPKEPVVVPVRRVYVVIHQVTLERRSDGVPVPAFNLSLSLDVSSWTWGFEALLPLAAEALLAPESSSGPVELVARIDGQAFRVLAESLSRERSFGEASLRVSGRGHQAVLASPYAPVMAFGNAEERTARQLMEEVLRLNGVSLGWAIDWDLTDWSVPAGAFSHQGTWIEALGRIAGAAGGYLIPHASDDRIRVRHRWPVAPWAWDGLTPDLVLPVDAVARESLRWLERPAYNRVFVSGQEVGILGQVTRAGTAGEVLAPGVVDALITEAAAARQRGLAVLADTGTQFEVSLRLPVLPETGIVEPGTFVEYRDGGVTRRGLVRSTQVEAGLPEVWQTLGVQGHAEPV